MSTNQCFQIFYIPQSRMGVTTAFSSLQFIMFQPLKQLCSGIGLSTSSLFSSRMTTNFSHYYQLITQLRSPRSMPEAYV